jgi:hypothetical protein
MTKKVVMATWDDAPHLSADAKESLLASIPEYQRDARTKGIPALGSGAIYPVSESDIKVEVFQIPAFWPRGFGMDVGWNFTAAVFGAHDRETDTVYLYDEVYRQKSEPASNAEAIRRRGEWMNGVVDPAARGRGQKDGEQLLQSYRDLGLNIQTAQNGVEAGIFEVYKRMTSGRLRVFPTLTNWWTEFRLYRRDEKGNIVKKMDHCLHPETQVLTDRGHMRIIDMAGTEGRVMSLGGLWAPYRNVRKTASDQPVVRVTFEDGSEVVCTPDHRFLVAGEWREAIDIEGCLCETAVSRFIGEYPWKSLSSPQPSRSSRDGVIISAETTSNVTVSGCTSRSGRGQTVGRRRPGTMSIMLTRIAAITSPAIWFSRRLRSISQTISKGFQSLFLLPRWRLQPSGTAQMQGDSGTLSTMPEWATCSTSKAPSPAKTAGRLSRLRTWAATAFARTPAKPATGTIPGSITSSAPASNAGQPSPSTNTSRPRTVVESVRLRCLAVRDAGRSDVYCMTVPGLEAFAVETGVIVHNCMDATRYYIVSGLPLSSTDPGHLGKLSGKKTDVGDYDPLNG